MRTLPALAVSAAMAAGIVPGCGTPERAPRSVVLISIDTLRPDRLGAYGYARPSSPTLDALAREGVRFDVALAPSPWTLPSHASLLTGLYPRHHGLKSPDRRFAADVALWAQLLSERGFATAAVVNSLYLTKRPGFDRGFDSFEYVREEPARRKPSGVRHAAERWLDELAEDRFFLFLHFYDVHSDYASLPVYEREFVRPYTGALDGSTAQLLRSRQGKLSIDPADRDHLVDLYVAGIRQIDAEIAELLESLRQRGRLADTLLIVTSDHGEEFLEHGGVLHGRTLYDELLRVPLILRGPGVPPDRQVTTPVSLVDVLPTAFGLLGIPGPDGIDGRDVSPLWQGKTPAELIERPLFGEADHNNAHDDSMRSVRAGGFKLIFDRVAEEYRLFDLIRDPGENDDVLDEHPDRAAALTRSLETFVQGGTTAETTPPLDPEEAERLKALGYM